MLDISSSDFWIILGAVFIIAETFFVSGLGLLFGGLAAFTTGGLIHYQFILPGHYINITYFLGFTIFYLLILWLPLKKLVKKSQPDIQNIIGEKACVVDNDLNDGNIGKVKWSGTIFNAKLLSDETKKLDSEVEIVEIKGNILIVK